MYFLSHRPKMRNPGLLLGMLLAVSAGVSAQDNNYVVTGNAYSLETNQLVYRELYTSVDESKQVHVDYVSPEGDVFATKNLTYQGEPFQPQYELVDNRDDEKIGVRFDGPRMILFHAMRDMRNEKTLFDNARVVVDAGFDAYIQLNWDQLIAGKSLRFDFAFPTRLSTVALEVRKIKAADSPVYDNEYGQQWVYFRIAPAKKLASLFADPIFLAYDPNGKYLMRFHGRSNIDDQYSGPWDVRIEYEYTN
jgi:hypothetical protein